MNKIFILGATGNLGGLAIGHLLDMGVPADRLVAVVRDMDKAGWLRQRGIEIRKGDYDDSDFSPKVFQGADKLLFVSSPSMDGLHRIKQHATVVEAARDAGVGHIVYTGLAFPAAHGTPLRYVHQATELALEAAGVPFTVLRNAFYMEYFIVKAELDRALGSGKLLSAANGQKVNFVSRNDLALAAAAVLAAEGQEGKVYELTYPQAYSYADVAAVLSRVSGKAIIHKDVGMEELRESMERSGLTPEQMSADSSAFQPAFASGWAGATSDALVNLIGRDRLTSLEAYIRKLYE